MFTLHFYRGLPQQNSVSGLYVIVVAGNIAAVEFTFKETV